MKYRIQFYDGSVFEGEPSKIIRDLRDSSMFETDIDLQEYIENMADRHNMFLKPELETQSQKDFVKSLENSPIVSKFETVV